MHEEEAKEEEEEEFFSFTEELGCGCGSVSPLSHEGDVDAVSSSDGSKRDEPADDRREALQRWEAIGRHNQTHFKFVSLFTRTARLTEARDLSPRAVTTAPVVALT